MGELCTVVGSWIIIGIAVWPLPPAAAAGETPPGNWLRVINCGIPPSCPSCGLTPIICDEPAIIGNLADEVSICGVNTVPPVDKVVGIYVMGRTVVGQDCAPAVAISCMFPPPVPITVLTRGDVLLSVVETFTRDCDSTGG